MLNEKVDKFVPGIVTALISFLAGAMFVLGGYFTYINYFPYDAKAQVATGQNVVPASISAKEELPDIAGIVKNVSPAIVNIETTVQNSINPYFNDSFYREFFGRQIPIQPRRNEV